MRRIHWVRNGKWQPAYLCIGDGLSLKNGLDFTTGKRRICERAALNLQEFIPLKPFSQDPILSTILTRLYDVLPNIQDGLLFITSHYKETEVIGPVRLKNKEQLFVKCFKESIKEEEIRHRNVQLSSLYDEIPFITTPTLQSFQHHIACYDYIAKNGSPNHKAWLQQLRVQLPTTDNYISLQPVMDMLAINWPEACKPLPELYDFSVTYTIQHGDMTPWNIFRSKVGNTVVVDDERIGDYPLYYDWLHFQLQPLFLSHCNINDIYKSAMRCINHETIENATGYLIAYLLCQCATDAKHYQKYKETGLIRVINRKIITLCKVLES